MGDPTRSTDATHPPRWLMLQASAPLDAVATTNFACYGQAGVPRYPYVMLQAPHPTEAGDPPTLCAELLLRDAQDRPRLALLDLTLRQRQADAKQYIWETFDAQRRLHIVWVWDFFRILSHAVLRAQLPPTDAAPSDPWAKTLEAVRAMRAGDIIEFNVASACGNIRQRHTLGAPAREWTSAPRPNA